MAFNVFPQLILFISSVCVLATTCLGYRPGDFVPMALQTQYHTMRTPFDDVLGRHCPRFGIDREVLLPIPQPTGYTGADPYKIALQIGKEKFHTPWLFVIGRQSAEVPMITVKLRYAGGDLIGAVAKVDTMPHKYIVQHESVKRNYWDTTKWPKKILVQYQWEKQSLVDVEAGLYVLFGSGFIFTLVIALHILQSSKDKVTRFVKETVVSNTLPGEVAKVE